MSMCPWASGTPIRNPPRRLCLRFVNDRPSRCAGGTFHAGSSHQCMNECEWCHVVYLPVCLRRKVSLSRCLRLRHKRGYWVLTVKPVTSFYNRPLSLLSPNQPADIFHGDELKNIFKKNLFHNYDLFFFSFRKKKRYSASFDKKSSVSLLFWNIGLRVALWNNIILDALYCRLISQRSSCV